MSKRKLCKATTKTGRPCRAAAITDDGLCRVHAMSDEARVEQARKGHAGLVRSRRAKGADPLVHFKGATQQQIINMIGQAFSGQPIDPRTHPGAYFGPREKPTPEAIYFGLHLVLALTGPHMTPTEARAAIEATLPEGMRPVYTPPAEDVFKAARARWRQTALMYEEARGVFVLDYPPDCFAAWEDPAHVLRVEPLPDLSEWETGPLGDSETHVKATAPDGTEHLIRRMTPEEARARRLAALGLDTAA